MVTEALGWVMVSWMLFGQTLALTICVFSHTLTGKKLQWTCFCEFMILFERFRLDL